MCEARVDMERGRPMSPAYPRVRFPGVSRAASEAPEGDRESTFDHLFVREVVRLALFLPHDHYELASGVAHALERYRHAVAGVPTALVHGRCCWWEYSRLDEEEWRLIRETLEPGEPRFFDDYEPHEAFYAEKEGAEPYFDLRGEPGSGYGFSYSARLPWRESLPNRVSVLTATLPTEYLEEHGPAHVRELVLDMASRLPFASGHAGLALDLWNPLRDEWDRLRAVLFRHPGFDVRAASIHDDMGTRVDGIHWMNLLGQPVLGELGGAEGLRARLHSPGTTVRELGGERVVVTLGERPEAGDLARGERLPAHRELARVLEPWLEPPSRGLLGRQDRATDEEELRRWWRRFLD
jgi:hypothetical protein